LLVWQFLAAFTSCLQDEFSIKKAARGPPLQKFARRSSSLAYYTYEDF